MAPRSASNRSSASARRSGGAAGWQINEMTVRLQQASGITHASDGRGVRPYRIAIGGEPIGPVQYPSTLPTLDELLGRDGLDESNVDRRLLETTERASEELPQVFTLHAELEGQKMPVFRRLLDGWQQQGWTIGSLGDVHQAWAGREIASYRCAGARCRGDPG